ncbi:hypothetical protein PIB30_087091 [Stylosanthes scabra]|uniref:Uncharacterized protein n=1 Tax=Stylosanthes scabra TaxID=79078 RepID=A0ABU6WWP2_9FABA|nr:hypothetical protein [Stylosanthes scabra]
MSRGRFQGCNGVKVRNKGASTLKVGFKGDVQGLGHLVNGTHKVKPSGQREDKGVQTSYVSLTKARIIKVSRNGAALVSSTRYPSRKHSHVNLPGKEMSSLSNGGGRLLQGRYKGSL